MRVSSYYHTTRASEELERAIFKVQAYYYAHGLLRSTTSDMNAFAAAISGAIRQVDEYLSCNPLWEEAARKYYWAFYSMMLSSAERVPSKTTLQSRRFLESNSGIFTSVFEYPNTEIGGHHLREIMVRIYKVDWPMTQMGRLVLIRVFEKMLIQTNFDHIAEAALDKIPKHELLKVRDFEPREEHFVDALILVGRMLLDAAPTDLLDREVVSFTKWISKLNLESIEMKLIGTESSGFAEFTDMSPFYSMGEDNHVNCKRRRIIMIPVWLYTIKTMIENGRVWEFSPPFFRFFNHHCSSNDKIAQIIWKVTTPHTDRRVSGLFGI